MNRLRPNRSNLSLREIVPHSVLPLTSLNLNKRNNLSHRLFKKDTTKFDSGSSKQKSCSFRLNLDHQNSAKNTRIINNHRDSEINLLKDKNNKPQYAVKLQNQFYKSNISNLQTPIEKRVVQKIKKDESLTGNIISSETK